MLPYIHYPVLLNIGSLKIHTFGLMIALGFIVAILLVIKFGKEKGYRIDHLTNIAFISLFSGTIGARVLYVLERWDLYKDYLFDIIKVWEGGMAWFGGLIFAILASYIYMKANKLNFLKVSDICAIPLAVGLFIGRIGCLLGDGGHVGKITTSFLGVMVNGELRHYTVVYEFMFLIPLIILLFLLRKKEYFDGALFMIFLGGYSIGRFFTDFFRADPTYWGLTAPQIISAVMFTIISIFLIKRLLKRNKVITS